MFKSATECGHVRYVHSVVQPITHFPKGTLSHQMSLMLPRLPMATH